MEAAREPVPARRDPSGFFEATMKSETEFSSWLHSHLDTIQLGDEEFVDYIVNILKEGTIDQEEKVVSIVTFLDAAAPDVPESFTTEIVDKWAELDKLLAEEKKREDAARRGASTTHKALSEAASAVEALSLDEPRRESSRGNMDSAARRRLLQQYGYESDEDEEGDGQDKDDDEQSLAAANRGAVKAVADAKKEDAKKAHLERVQRDKAALEKDRKSKQEKKEARQKAAQKGERRR